MFSQIGQHIIHLEEVDSTNLYLSKDLQSKDWDEGVLVVADNQYSGRGVSGEWGSERGKNLTFSFLLKPNFLKIKDQFLLNYMIASSIHECLSKYLNSVSIKWPNDILVADRKISGVLIENTISGSNMANSIVGIGINVNQNNFESFDRPATSLARELGKEQSLTDLLVELVLILNKNYLKLRMGKGKEFRDYYLSHLYLKNEISAFESEGVVFDGKVLGVDDFGQLILEIEGKQQAFQLKQIKFYK